MEMHFVVYCGCQMYMLENTFILFCYNKRIGNICINKSILGDMEMHFVVYCGCQMSILENTFILFCYNKRIGNTAYNKSIL
ncbi:hypothetical protein T4D_12154 [Trichinella pseudospiralis]|uniref:Uncharacterized protein n=1 Tax=Trichinella pseudospiralis TaxID=6337 RepID=A0A0V1F6N3_TRIPS|nr:hypothetical protein T4D_12154 [Trichinella pseudospiralis]